MRPGRRGSGRLRGVGLAQHDTSGRRAARGIRENGHVTDTLELTRPQLVLFDLDGTLTDSAAGIVSSFRHALTHVGAGIPDGDLAGRIVGPPMHETLQALSRGETSFDADAAIAA